MTTDTQDLIIELVEAGDHLIGLLPAEVTHDREFSKAVTRWERAKFMAQYPRCSNCGVAFDSQEHHLPETIGRCQIITDRKDEP